MYWKYSIQALCISCITHLYLYSTWFKQKQKSICVDGVQHSAWDSILNLFTKSQQLFIKIWTTALLKHPSGISAKLYRG